ncbi:MAG: acyltransferase family protein [Desulfatibacillum sp.]|nr:acyltransferase family protein [Desulfatibacillum sp.]
MSITSTLLKKAFVSSEIEEVHNRITKEVGSFGYDAWGYSRDGAAVCLGVFKTLYDHYFRVEAEGLENIPKQGRVLIIANHSGQLPMDGALIGIAIATNPHGPRAPRTMIERFFPMVPFVGNLLNMGGAVIGDPINCLRMLRREECVVVFPEGVRGSGKSFKKRYKLQRFGFGFMHIAMETNTPIIPVGVVGCEETMPSLANIKPLANLLGLPYVPIAIPFPLPSKVYLNFGKPLQFEGEVEKEKQVIENVEVVKDAIRGLIDKGLAQKSGWFFS